MPVPVKLGLMFTRIFLDGGILLKFPLQTRNGPREEKLISPVESSLRASVEQLNFFFDYVLNLEQSQILSFCGVDWTRVILSIILAFRLSFPTPRYPGWDSTWARSMLRFDDFLIKMSNEGELTIASKKVDILSGFKVVVRVVKEKYEARLAQLSPSSDYSSSSGCPMLDGSLTHYLRIWDPPINTADIQPITPSTDPSTTDCGVAFQDLWATMTMGWANDGDMLD
jgi:hypothetical protein